MWLWRSFAVQLHGNSLFCICIHWLYHLLGPHPSQLQLVDVIPCKVQNTYLWCISVVMYSILLQGRTCYCQFHSGSRKMEWFSCYGNNKHLNLLNFTSTKGKSPMQEEAGIKKQLNLILLGVALQFSHYSLEKFSCHHASSDSDLCRVQKDEFIIHTLCVEAKV